ncbi:MAG TPA: glycosyl hydrolase family 18 protein, partial [Aggregatilineales bacterium]|nr:glycosyl hydrolase family 18 protein [Aggregatilineales bacterium]
TGIQNLAADLQSLQIQYGFFYVTYLKENGEFNSTYDHAETFLHSIKTAAPDLQILAWIGIPLLHTDLSDSDVRRQITSLCHELIEMGFDGIHLNAEPIHNNNADLLKLLEEIRQTTGEDVILSLAAHRIFPILPQILGAPSSAFLEDVPVWNIEYYQSIGQRVDQIAVMIYDSAMPTSLLFRHWSRFQTIYLSQVLQHSETQLLLGVPASEKHTPTHNPDAENMENGLRGIITGLNDHATEREVITGVAIYPYWETSDEEWKIYRELWLGEKESVN